MGAVNKIKRLLKKVLALVRFSSGELQPRDILSKIITELESRKKHGIDENAFVPNIYTVSLSPADHEELSPLLVGVREQIRRKIMERIGKKDYKLLSSTVSLEIRKDPELQKNQVAVESCFEKEKGATVHAVETPAGKGKKEQAPDSSITKIVEEKKTTIIENPKLQVEILEGENKGDIFPLSNGEHTFGRGKDAVVMIRDEDDSISRVHFKIIVKDGQVSIQDLHSTNGTRVNDEEVEETEINLGDTIGAGKVLMKVV